MHLIILNAPEVSTATIPSSPRMHNIYKTMPQTKSDHGFAGPRWSPVTCAIPMREMLGVQELDGGECGAFGRF